MIIFTSRFAMMALLFNAGIYYKTNLKLCLVLLFFAIISGVIFEFNVSKQDK